MFKNLLLLTLIITLILPSCSIEKRRYMPGYHIIKNNKKIVSNKVEKKIELPEINSNKTLLASDNPLDVMLIMEDKNRFPNYNKTDSLCSINNCRNVVLNSAYCSLHKCIWNGCVAKKSSTTQYCKQHNDKREIEKTMDTEIRRLVNNGEPNPDYEKTIRKLQRKRDKELNGGFFEKFRDLVQKFVAFEIKINKRGDEESLMKISKGWEKWLSILISFIGFFLAFALESPIFFLIFIFIIPSILQMWNGTRFWRTSLGGSIFSSFLIFIFLVAFFGVLGLGVLVFYLFFILFQTVGWIYALLILLIVGIGLFIYQIIADVSL